MTANTAPIYSRYPSVSNNNGTGMNQAVTAAANDYTGVSANNSLIFTAGSDGAYIQRVRLKACGTNVPSVMRFYVNNGSTNTAAANNTFFSEVALLATTATITGATMDVDVPCNFGIDPSFRLFMGLGTAVAAGWVALVIAGKY